MQAAQPVDQLVPGTQIEMIGVAQQNLAADFTQVARQDGLDRALCAHRHEAGRLHHTVRGDKATEASPGAWVFLDNREMAGHRSILDFRLSAKNSDVSCRAHSPQSKI